MGCKAAPAISSLPNPFTHQPLPIMRQAKVLQGPLGHDSVRVDGLVAPTGAAPVSRAALYLWGLPAKGCKAAPAISSLPNPFTRQPLPIMRQAKVLQGPLGHDSVRVDGLVAPTGAAPVSRAALYLWELACLRWAAKQPRLSQACQIPLPANRSRSCARPKSCKGPLGTIPFGLMVLWLM